MPQALFAADRPSEGPSATLRAVPPLFHALAFVWVAGMVALAIAAPAAYDRAVQEDHLIEWWTVTLFAAAAWFGLRRSLPRRRLFDVLVALFCVFVAGEEFSWGQRLLGFTPPDAFLEHNKQQEFTLHNFTAIVREPKSILILALAGYGLLLPALARVDAGRRLLARVRATSAPLALAPWFAATVALLVWYPFSFTGEWVEALAGGLFLVALAPAPRSAARAAVAALVIAGGLTLVSGRGLGANPEQLACAEREAHALLDDLVYGSAARPRLAEALSVHKRVYTAALDGYVTLEAAEQFRTAGCAEATRPASRRAHAIDPWGNAYWLAFDASADGRRLAVYSFGPNRRRDDGGDDVVASIALPP